MFEIEGPSERQIAKDDFKEGLKFIAERFDIYNEVLGELEEEGNYMSSFLTLVEGDISRFVDFKLFSIFYKLFELGQEPIKMPDVSFFCKSFFQ